MYLGGAGLGATTGGALTGTVGFGGTTGACTGFLGLNGIGDGG